VAATPQEAAHEDIAYRAHVVASRERELAVVNVLRALEPSSALVFRATRESAHHTASSLSERGFEAVGISGELTQAERTRALKALRDGHARVLVATDVAARGLDLPSIELVLHADLPRDPQALQHRSGRTGRAGRKGLAVLLAAPSERFKLERMLRDARIAVEWAPVPAADTIRARDDERLAARVEALAEEATEDELAAARRLLDGREPLLVAAALVRGERSRLPAPEELPETAAAAREAPAQRAERKARGGPPKDVVWFRIGLGREKKADPKWLLPLLCRRGGVTRDEIGKIIVGAGETRFEVAKGAAARFGAAARKPDPRAPGVRIELVREHAGPRGRAHSERKVRTPNTAETSHERNVRASARSSERQKPRP
jgi:ATP-dependent RNA helicase DeaD